MKCRGVAGVGDKFLTEEFTKENNDSDRNWR